MRISTKGRYAIHIMLDIAQNSDGSYVSLKDIAARQELSLKYLEQIATFLCKAGMLKSERGPQGGYKLSKTPEEYTLGSILRLTEGNMAPVACLADRENRCEKCDSCATVDFWDGLYKVICDYIDKYTLEDLQKSSDSKMKKHLLKTGEISI